METREKKGQCLTCRLTPLFHVTCLRTLNVFCNEVWLEVFVFFFLRFYEHIAFHKAFHKHKNDISIFPHKWQICRKRKNQQDSLETILYTPRECGCSPLLALTSVTHADALLEAKAKSSTSRSLARVGAGM